MFEVGTKVALVYISSGPYPARYSQRTVARVTKTGQFTLDGDDTTKWRPEKYREDHARKVGASNWEREHIELWTDEHDQIIARERALRDRRVRLNAVQEIVAKMRAEHASDEIVEALERALKIEGRS
jgi:hypothetical protein